VGRPAFATAEIYEALEARKVKYVIRIPANDSLRKRRSRSCRSGLLALGRRAAMDKKHEKTCERRRLGVYCWEPG